MNLVRFDPFRELEAMSTRLNRLFGSSPIVSADADGFGAWAPAVDVEENATDYVVKADLPDVKKADVKVGIADGVLTIEGERKQEREEKDKKFHRIERAYGQFVRRLSVPTDVDQTQVAADFKDGVLHVRLPKSANAKPRSVEVKVA